MARPMASSRRNLALAAAAVAVAAGTFVVLSPGEDDRETASTAATVSPAVTIPTATTAKPGPPPAPEADIVRLRAGAPVGGVQRIDVESGERVRLDVRSDTPQEIHVHGFDVTKTAAPGIPARFRFKADIEGRFEVETHATGTVIAEIAVSP